MKGEANRVRRYLDESTWDRLPACRPSPKTSLSDSPNGVTSGENVRQACYQLNRLDAYSVIENELADIFDEYLQQLEAGAEVSTDDLVARFPHHEDAIREYMKGLNLLNAGIAEIADSSFHGGGGKGTTLGEYEIVREIGRGGMGVVYEAKQRSLGRTVALKVLPFVAMLDQSRVVRFEAEARAAARLQHAHIVPVYSIGCDGGVHYYAMQLIEGASIRNLIDSPESVVAPRDVAGLGTQVANALHAAHECGIVHRDIKPSNLLVDENNNAWITDFGLARCQTEENVTRSGDMLGTLHYMSPERVHGYSSIADPRSDVYSLGVTLYELLTSQRPFEGESHTEIVQRIELGQFKSIRSLNTDVPRDLENVITKAMSVEPELRYQTAADLEADLQRFVDGRATLAQPPSKMQLATRWASRNRVLVLGLSAALLMTSVALGATTFWLARARSDLAAKHAVANQKLAATESTLEEFGLVTAERLRQIPGTESARKALLGRLLTHYEDLLEAAENNPSLREDRAITSTKIANIYRESGDLEKALETYRQAQNDFRLLQEGVAGSQTSRKQVSPTAHFANSTNDSPLAHEVAQTRLDANALLAKCLSNTSVVLMELGELDEATRECERAIVLQQRIAQVSPTATALLDLACSHVNLDSIRNRLGNNGLQDLERAGDLLQRALQKCSHEEQLAVLDTLSTTYRRLSERTQKLSLEDAMRHAESAVAFSRRITQSTESPEINVYRSTHAGNCNHLASLYSLRGQHAEATELFARAAAELSAAGARDDRVMTLSRLAKSQGREHNFVGATETYQEAITAQAALLLEAPGNLNHQSRLGGLYNNMAFSLKQLGEHENACSAYEAAIKYQDRGLSACSQGSGLLPGRAQQNFVQQRRSLHGHESPASRGPASSSP